MNKSATAYPGLGWSVVCLVLHIAELLVLTEIVFFDRQRGGFTQHVGLIEIYFAVTLLTTAGFAVGIWMVSQGRYHAGGMVQIISIAPQVLKVDGIIGVIGGVKAIRHARAIQDGASAS
jgi:hypothetical protein